MPRPLARYCGCPSCCVISTVVGVKNTSSCSRHFRAAYSSSSAGGRAHSPRQPQPRIRTKRHDRCRPSHCCCHLFQPVTVAVPPVDLFPVFWVYKTPVCVAAAFQQHPRTRRWVGERMLQGNHSLGYGPSATTAAALTAAAATSSSPLLWLPL